MKTKKINKCEFIKGIECKRLLWLSHNDNYKYKSNWNTFSELNSMDFINNEDDNYETAEWNIYDPSLVFTDKGLDTIEGIEVGKLARIYFENQYGKENCLNCENLKISNEEILNNTKYKVFFEPKFEIDNAVTKLDILLRNEDNSYTVYEVKSKTFPDIQFKWDLGYQLYLLNRCNVNIHSAQLMYVNSEFRYDGTYNYENDIKKLKDYFIFSKFLFKSKDKYKEYLTKCIKDRENYTHKIKIDDILGLHKEEISDYIQKSYLLINLIDIPDDLKAFKVYGSPKLKCKKCPFYKYCLLNYQQIYEQDIKNTVYAINDHRKKCKSELVNTGIINIKEIPNSYMNKFRKDTDKSIKEALKSDKKELKKPTFLQHIQLVLEDRICNIDINNLSKLLNNWKFPIYMLDFESVNSAIPFIKNTTPYKQIAFQYSIHIINGLEDLNFDTDEFVEKNIIHKEFFCDLYSKESFELQIIKALIRDFNTVLDTNFTTLAYYKSFEIGILKNLRIYCDENGYYLESKKIEKIESSIKDLMDPFRLGYYYNINQLLMQSIKIVLPTLIESYQDSYKKLNIKNGKEATDIFKSLYRDHILTNSVNSRNLVENKIKDFLEYCCLDTKAMILILKKLIKLSKNY